VNKDHSVSEQTYQYFVQEATELLQVMEGELKELRSQFSVRKVHTLMRAAHTLKGASASVGLDTIQKATHSLEDVFKALCHRDTVITEAMEQLIFEGYDCLQQLVSAQFLGAKVDGDDSLNQMAVVVSHLQDLLGDRLGQGGQLPTSAELGFDMTLSIFQVGVAQRIEQLEKAVERNHPAELRTLLQKQADVFVGLGESLNLPGFEEIARMTQQAIAQYPNLILQIAPVVLDDFRAAKKAVLAGDRTQGGVPSVALQQFCGGYKIENESVDASSNTKILDTPTAEDLPTKTLQNTTALTDTALIDKKRESVEQTLSEKTPNSQSTAAPPAQNWFKRRWKKLTHPIGEDASTQQEKSHTADPLSEAKEQTSLAHSSVDSELSELAPTDLDLLNLQVLPDEKETPEGPALSESVNVQNLSIEELVAEPATLSAAGATSADPQKKTPTVRISVAHLDRLNQSMGELLTAQNKQALYSDQLTALVGRLLDRISQQQQQLNQQQIESLIRKRSSIHQNLSPTAAVIKDKRSARNSDYTHFDSLELEQYNDVQMLLQSALEETVQQSESAEAIELFVTRSRQTLDKQKRLLANTRETLLEARMVPLSSVFQPFAAAIERLERLYQKPVEVTIEGGDLLVDKTIADSLYEPLLHLTRNAFDHGIESASERLEQDKLPTGRITVTGKQQGRHLLISVRDDGRGLDLEAIRAKAIENRLITSEMSLTLSEQQTVDFLFEPGFSTTVSTDTLSGRGVGLDAVKAGVRSLKGWITVSHEPGEGTCFTLQVPANLTIAKLLLCQAQGRIYALIADAVEHILIPQPEQVRRWEGGKMLTWQTNTEEYLVPVNVLDEVLHYASVVPSVRSSLSGGLSNSLSGSVSNSPQGTTAQDGEKQATANPVILLHHQNSLVGLEVEQLLGEQELVINPLGETIAPPAYLYGSSILPDGQLTLVLDGLMLAKIMVQQRRDVLEKGGDAFVAKKAIASKNSPIFQKPLILTVDDSITVRNTLTEALQKANYQVLQARDGAEALEMLTRYPEVQTILCDIEMPGMNGFEFLKARQKQPEIAAIPTIMLTSRMGTKHRRLTEALGASGYLTKPYLTPKLLQAISKAMENSAMEKPTTEKSAVTVSETEALKLSV